MVHFVCYSFPQILISSNCPNSRSYRNFMLKYKMSSEEMEGPVCRSTNAILLSLLQHIIHLQVCSVKYSTFTPLQLHSFQHNHSTYQIPSREANSHSHIQEILPCTELQGSLPCSQKSTTDLYPEPQESSP